GTVRRIAVPAALGVRVLVRAPRPMGARRPGRRRRGADPQRRGPIDRRPGRGGVATVAHRTAGGPEAPPRRRDRDRAAAVLRVLAAPVLRLLGAAVGTAELAARGVLPAHGV